MVYTNMYRYLISLISRKMCDFAMSRKFENPANNVTKFALKVARRSVIRRIAIKDVNSGLFDLASAKGKNKTRVENLIGF